MSLSVCHAVLGRALCGVFRQHAVVPVQGSSNSKVALLGLVRDRVLYCVRHHRSLDVAASLHEEVALLSSLVTGPPTADAGL